MLQQQSDTFFPVPAKEQHGFRLLLQDNIFLSHSMRHHILKLRLFR